MDWKKELDIRFNQLKEEKDELRTVRENSRDSSRSVDRSSSSAAASDSSNNHGNRGSSVLRRGLSSEAGITIKDERRNNLMITREAALDDLEKLEKEATDSNGRLLVQVAKVLVKVLATIRSNQLLTDEDKKRIQAARATRKPETK